MLIQEVLTDLSPREVIDRARAFFTSRASPWTGFVDEESDTHIRFKNEAAELLVAAVPQEGGRTLVRGSTSRMRHDLSAFLTTLAPPEEVRESVAGPGTSGAGGPG